MFSNLPLKWILKFAKRNKILNFKQNKNKTYLVIGSAVEASFNASNIIVLVPSDFRLPGARTDMICG